MKMTRSIWLLIALSSCGSQRQPQQPQTNTNAPVPPAQSAPPAVANNATPAAQPTDPKSSQAAVELAEKFVDLLNNRRFDEAYMLLGPGAPPRREFDRRFSSLSGLNVGIGNPGEQEGAAGSVYLSVPLTVSGTVGGKQQTNAATAIMRRVNDVPGSTEAQRRWHIERIDWENGA